MNNNINISGKSFIRTVHLMMLISVFLMASVLSAHAMSSLQLSDGSTTILIDDEGPYDTLPGIIGGIGYNGSVGVFNFTVTTGFITPFIGTSELPMLSLSSIGVSSSGSGGTLTIMFTGTDFGPASAPVIETNVGGTNHGTVSFNTYVNSSNAAFGTETLVGSFGTSTYGAFDSSTSSIFSSSHPFSITTVATLTHGSGNNASSFGLTVNVAPEPFSSTLFVIGGTLLGFRIYQKKRK